jgi:hypothetical protein
MVKISEPVIKTVKTNKRKWLSTLEPKGNGSWKMVGKYIFVAE